MSLKSVFVSTLLWFCVTAAPAGPGYFPFNTSSTPDENDSRVSITAFGLMETYDASNWLDKFDVQAIRDPTHGFVNYVNQQEAQQRGLIKTQNNQVYMGVDTTSFLNPTGVGRSSVRIQSKRAYNQALVIADFAHIPGTACGSWPAFWMVGPNWPHQGELDIIEGVNLNEYNHVALHTSPGCTPHVGDGGQSGRRVGHADCGTDGGYVGCGVESTSPTSYGTPFNANGGGVYAAQWTNSGIKVWYFAARDVPGNIRNGNPDPGSWGVPQANFAGCDFGDKFRDMRMVFDITFCGDWAGSVWGQSSCSGINPSCHAYVASQPQSFYDSYWLVNSIKVYSV